MQIDRLLVSRNEMNNNDKSHRTVNIQAGSSESFGIDRTNESTETIIIICSIAKQPTWFMNIIIPIEKVADVELFCSKPAAACRIHEKWVKV